MTTTGFCDLKKSILPHFFERNSGSFLSSVTYQSPEKFSGSSFQHPNISTIRDINPHFYFPKSYDFHFAINPIDKMCAGSSLPDRPDQRASSNDQINIRISSRSIIQTADGGPDKQQHYLTY